MILVGPFGSGKPTALRMVTGLEAITEGEIRIGDELVNQLTLDVERHLDRKLATLSDGQRCSRTVSASGSPFGARSSTIQKCSCERHADVDGG